MHKWPASPVGERKPFMLTTCCFQSGRTARSAINTSRLMTVVDDRCRIRSRLRIGAGACLRRTVRARTVTAGLSGGVLSGNTRFSGLKIGRVVDIVRGGRIVASLFQLDQLGAHLSAGNRLIGLR